MRKIKPFYAEPEAEVCPIETEGVIAASEDAETQSLIIEEEEW